MNGRVLVVDCDDDFCDFFREGLEKRDFAVETTTDGESALQVMRDREIDVMVTDIQIGTISGLDLCKQVAANWPDVPVVVITAFGNMEVAVLAIRAGAYEFINKPFRMDEIALTLKRAVRHRQLQNEVERLRKAMAERRRLEGLVGESPAMQKVYDVIEQVAQSDITVLVTGESGTGKELVARAIHERSDRAEAPFVAINCAAMPANLLERELFGHGQAPLTGIERSREPLFVQANGGTLLLDEICEMPLETQAKILRVLQERKVRPVGGDAELPFHTRVIAATSRDLETEVEEKRFREDLYYRINVVRIHVPPLRSRGNDVLLLAQCFLERYAKRNDKPVLGLSSATAQKLIDYDWPGNVRELENSMERAAALTRSSEITVDELPEKIRDYQRSKIVIDIDDPEQLPTLDEVERQYIRRVLEAVGGNKRLAARILGLHGRFRPPDPDAA